MLHIILLILKILGCIILGILALLLAAVLIVLFVPFKYELSAAYDLSLIHIEMCIRDSIR